MTTETRPLSPKGEMAIAYADRGWRVFPLHPNSKIPMTDHGFKDATSDHTQILEWWTQHPAANIGIATGSESGIWVLDVDPVDKKTGKQTTAWESLERLMKKYPDFDPQFIVETPLGGIHVYSTYDPQNPVSSRPVVDYPNIDARGDRGYVVAPGCSVWYEQFSYHGSYTFLTDANEDPTPAPVEMCRLLASDKPQRTQEADVKIAPKDFPQEQHDALMARYEPYRDLWNGTTASGDNSRDVFVLIRHAWDGLSWVSLKPSKTGEDLPKMTPGDYYRLIEGYYDHVGAPDTHKPAWIEKEVKRLYAEKAPRVVGNTEYEGHIPFSLPLSELLARSDLMAPPTPVIPNFVYRGLVTLYSSREKLGKSTLARSIAAKASLRGVKTTYLRLEETHYLVGNGLRRMGANDNVRVTNPQSPTLEALEADILANGTQVLVVDTLSAWLALNGVTDENSAGAVAPVMLAWQQLAQRTGVGILLIFHNNKDDKYRGSTAFGGNADVLINMTVKDNDPRRRFAVTGRVYVEDFKMRFDGTHYQYVDGCGEPSIERLYQAIHNTPYMGTLKIRRAMTGQRSEKTDADLAELISAGRVYDLGDHTAHKYITYDLYVKTDLKEGTLGEDTHGTGGLDTGRAKNREVNGSALGHGTDTGTDTPSGHGGCPTSPSLTGGMGHTTVLVDFRSSNNAGGIFGHVDWQRLNSIGEIADDDDAAEE